jgi:hypothetical protein
MTERQIDGAAVLSERRRDGDAIAWTLILLFGLAAWRGAAETPVLAAGMGLLGALGLAGWVRWRFRAVPRLSITRDEISYGRPGQVVARIPRTAGTLEIRRSRVVQSGWWLSPPGDSEGSGISMLGFDIKEVRRACLERGWEFGH